MPPPRGRESTKKRKERPSNAEIRQAHLAAFAAALDRATAKKGRTLTTKEVVAIHTRVLSRGIR